MFLYKSLRLSVPVFYAQTRTRDMQAYTRMQKESTLLCFGAESQQGQFIAITHTIRLTMTHMYGVLGTCVQIGANREVIHLTKVQICFAYLMHVVPFTRATYLSTLSCQYRGVRLALRIYMLFRYIKNVLRSYLFVRPFDRFGQSEG